MLSLIWVKKSGKCSLLGCRKEEHLTYELFKYSAATCSMDHSSTNMDITQGACSQIVEYSFSTLCLSMQKVSNSH